jgi:hypothetical protein
MRKLYELMTDKDLGTPDLQGRTDNTTTKEVLGI